MSYGIDRIICPVCKCNNMPDQSKCWKCSSDLVTNSPTNTLKNIYIYLKNNTAFNIIFYSTILIVIFTLNQNHEDQRKNKYISSPQFQQAFDYWKLQVIDDFKGDVTNIRLENNGNRIVFTVSDAWYRLPDYQKDRISDIFANRYLYFCIDNNVDTQYNLHIEDSWGKTVKNKYYARSN